MKYALIGCGRISVNHICAARNNKLQIVGVCDISEENMEREEYGLGSETKRYTSYQEMLKKEKPELVAIATESGKHARIALDCIAEGCHVIIEKPMALSLEDADSIMEQSEKNKVKVCVCHQNRFNKSILKIREALEQERFGRLLYGTAQIRWNRGKEYYTQAPWRGTWEQDGGALMNQCIHNLDLLRWMMGDEITEVIGWTDRLNHNFIEAEDFGAALVRFANGGYGIIEGTTDVYPKNMEETLCIFGSDGTVKVGGKSVNIIEKWEFRDKRDREEDVIQEFHESPPNIYGFGHTPLYRDMLEAIREDRKPYVDACAGKRAVELVLAVYQSSCLGHSVKLPLSGGSTMDFKGQFDENG